MNKFILKIAVLSALLFSIQYITFQQLSVELSTIYGVFYTFLIVITLLSHYLIMKQINKRPQLFVTYFMGLMTIKLFIALGIMLVAIWFNREDKFPLAITFMLLYFGYTFLSISSILPYLKNGKNTDNA
ncbi:hypothetical protein [Acidiluteibacter ferrifornacis]|uniref:Uncharacterized protein n=1 Tax=Acidiluteibacter ferrifornacis TaxID=2692424 RepID=A0A6N9NIM8_9FLAO|nr:hypothetical protein [Acidiluteibacter ferrifornacis]NBG65060.1 hypothetical protein [Acidiluteibacter ferrifornacis]